jgi:uncharacterized protein DUF6629
MCLSPEASFLSAAALLPAGIYCIKSARAKNPPFLCLAVVPVIFGIQQIAEGMVWLGLERGDSASAHAAGLVFLGFALAFWPFWIPMCGFVLEPPGPKRPLCGTFAALGLIGGLTMYLPLLLDPSVLVVRTSHHSIYYDMESSPVFMRLPLLYWECVYVVIIGVPALISKTSGVPLLGVAVVVSAGLTHVFFWYATVSVWCFFAAILSLYLCYAFWKMPALGRVSDRVHVMQGASTSHEQEC